MSSAQHKARRRGDEGGEYQHSIVQSLHSQLVCNCTILEQVHTNVRIGVGV